MDSVSAEKGTPERRMYFTAEGVRAELRQRVRDITALSPEDSRKAALRFTASVLKLPYSRVKRWYYDEVRRVEAHEADQIRAYFEAAHKLIEARAKYETERAEFLTAHPALVKVAPPSVDVVEVPQARVKRRKHG
jgi:hypothetical protein